MVNSNTELFHEHYMDITTESLSHLEYATIGLRVRTNTLSDAGSEGARLSFGHLSGLRFENNLEFGLQ